MARVSLLRASRVVLVVVYVTATALACPLPPPAAGFRCDDDSDCNHAAGYACVEATGVCALPDAGAAPAEGEGEGEGGGEGEGEGEPIDAGLMDAGVDAGPPPVTCPSDVTALDLTCDGAASSCAVELRRGDAGVDDGGFGSCLRCDAHLDRVILHQSGFGDESACDLGGWHLLAGDRCLSDLNTPTCGRGGPPRTCCSALEDACFPRDDGERLIRTDFDCGEETVLRNIFDLRGYVNARLCFAYGEVGAQDDDGLRITARDALTEREVTLACLPGDRLADGGMVEVCAELPPFTDDNRLVEIEVVLHTEGAARNVYFDDVRLDAVPLEPCGEPTVELDDHMNGCDEASDTAAEGWTVAGDLRCPETWTCAAPADPVNVVGAVGALERHVHLGDLERDARLCFDVGHEAANGSDGYVLTLDPGTGPVEVDRVDDIRALVSDSRRCVRRCVDLSEVPGLPGNTDVLLRFATAGDKAIGLDNVRLTGRRRCDAVAAGLVALGAAGDDGAGGYDIPLDAATPVSLELRCSLDDAPAVSDIDVVSLSP